MSNVPASNYGDLKRPTRMNKRIVDHVIAVELYDVWLEQPTKAYVIYHDYDEGHMMTKPIKIGKRKDGTYYVPFEGHRYNIDITLGKSTQYISDNDKNKYLRQQNTERRRYY